MYARKETNFFRSSYILGALLFLLLWSCTDSGILAGVNFTCPTFRDRVLNTVSCRINRTALIEAGCFPGPESVNFDRTVGSTTITRCFVTQIFNPSACNPASASGENRCWCNGYDGDVFEYKFSFKPNQTKDLGARLECRICLLTAKHLDVITNESCKNMTFEAEDLDSLDGSNVEVAADWTTELIVGFCIGAIIVISILLAIFYLIKYRRYGRLPVPTREHHEM